MQKYKQYVAQGTLENREIPKRILLLFPTFPKRVIYDTFSIYLCVRRQTQHKIKVLILIVV